MSPAILEQRIADLKRRAEDLEVELENEKLDHEKTRFERDCFKQRISGFERMSSALSLHVDKICGEFDRATGGRFRVIDGGASK